MNDNELNRLKSLYKNETVHYNRGIKFIGGLDEAGRGPLAGPVVSSVVILPKLTSNADYEELKGLKDSKKLSAKKRESFYKQFIKTSDIHIGIGIVGEKIIDKINILRATQMAMRKALANLHIKPHFLLIDGMVLPGIRIRQQKIVNGDNLSLSIAAASVVAKVTRDNIMCEYHKKYPQYSFDKHKGYGTKEHLRRLKECGPSPIHRKSFSPIPLMQEIGYEVDD